MLDSLRTKDVTSLQQGCINRSIIPSGMGARRVCSELVENMELWCALVFGEPCTGSRRTVLCMFVEGKSKVSSIGARATIYAAL